MRRAKKKVFFVVFCLLTAIYKPVVFAEGNLEHTIEKAYMEFIQQSVSPSAYYAIEKLGVNQMPVLLIGTEGKTEEDGKFILQDVILITMQMNR